MPYIATGLLRAFLVFGLSLLVMIVLTGSPWLGKSNTHSQSFQSYAAQSAQAHDLAVVSGVDVNGLASLICLDKENNHVSDLEIITGRHSVAQAPREVVAPVSQQLLAASRLERLLRPPRSLT